jgi:hypothetical protein
VADTRVTLDLVVSRFEEGAGPEEIVRSYDTLRLEDVYIVLAYYLTYKDEVQAYLKHREDEATKVRQQLEEGGVSRPGFWDELKARAAAAEKENVAPAQ